MKLLTLLFSLLTACRAFSLRFTHSTRQEGCVFPAVACGGPTCVDLRNSTENCGACGVTCASGLQCAQNLCVTLAALNASSTWSDSNVPDCLSVPKPGDPCNDNFSLDNYQYCTGPTTQGFVECVFNVWQAGVCGGDTVCGYQSAPWIKCYPASSGGVCRSDSSTSIVPTVVPTSVSTSVASTSAPVASTSAPVASTSAPVASTSAPVDSTLVASTSTSVAASTSATSSLAPTSVVPASTPPPETTSSEATGATQATSVMTSAVSTSVRPTTTSSPISLSFTQRVRLSVVFLWFL